MNTTARHLRTMDDIPLDGKRVLVRVDFNVTVGDDGIVDQYEDYRIETALPTIHELQRRRCKVLLLTHLGRPGEELGNFDLAPIGRRLKELLRDDVRQLKSFHGGEVEVALASVEPGGVVLLPNVRLDGREEARSQRFAADLVKAVDAYVNEAFSVSHRDHTSVALVPKLLPSCAGRRTVQEYETLQRLREHPDHPYVAIVSGAKVGTKVNLLRQLLQRVDSLCLGGRLANVFLAALGKGLVEQYDASDVAAASALLSEAMSKLVLPSDVIVNSQQGSADEGTLVTVDDVSADVRGIWDIGPDTVRRFLSVCESAKTIMWNGPVGKFEIPEYAKGTQQLAEGLSALSAFRVVGGGDTVHALELWRLTGRFDHVSVGGGAMVTVLEGGTMPGLEPLFE